MATDKDIYIIKDPPLEDLAIFLDMRFCQFAVISMKPRGRMQIVIESHPRRNEQLRLNSINHEYRKPSTYNHVPPASDYFLECLQKGFRYCPNKHLSVVLHVPTETRQTSGCDSFRRKPSTYIPLHI